MFPLFWLFHCFGYVVLFRRILVIYPCAKSPCIQQFFPVCRLHSVKRCELKDCCISIACLLYKELYKKYEWSSKSHCLFTTFRADMKSVSCPFYSSFVVLWGLLWNLKNNPQFAMCICITHLEMNTGLVSSLNLTNNLAPHFSHFFFFVWQLSEEARCTKKFCIQNMSLPDHWQTWKERELNYHHL